MVVPDQGPGDVYDWTHSGVSVSVLGVGPCAPLTKDASNAPTLLSTMQPCLFPALLRGTRVSRSRMPFMARRSRIWILPYRQLVVLARRGYYNTGGRRGGAAFM